jgi:hypothetical protein
MNWFSVNARRLRWLFCSLVSGFVMYQWWGDTYAFSTILMLVGLLITSAAVGGLVMLLLEAI